MKKGLFRKGKQIRSFLSRLPLLHKTGISLAAVTAVSLFIVTLPFSPAHSEPPTTTGLVGHWTFDEGTGTTAGDSSGNGNDGTLSNQTWTTGKVSGGLSFPTYYQVTVPNASSLVLTSAGTFSLWVKKTLSDSEGTLFVMGVDGVSGYRVGAGTFGTSTQLNFSKFYLAHLNLEGIPANTDWNHYALVFDSSGVDFYINGSLATSDPNTSAVITTSNALYLGGLAGILDDIRIYNRALTAQEIQDIYNWTGATPPVLSNPSPTGTLPLGTTQTTLSLDTDVNATCKYSTTAGQAYSAMTDTFSTTGGTNHSTNVSGLADGQSYTY
jgi:Concanavalin A-like lectin/glucanases superfamily